MPEFVGQEVRRRAREPSDSTFVRLLIGYDEDRAAVEVLVADVGGEVVEHLPFDSLSATIPETALTEVIDHPAVESVEVDSGMETLQGN